MDVYVLCSREQLKKYVYYFEMCLNMITHSCVYHSKSVQLYQWVEWSTERVHLDIHFGSIHFQFSMGPSLMTEAFHDYVKTF
jgi:hypothetical protein